MISTKTCSKITISLWLLLQGFYNANQAYRRRPEAFTKSNGNLRLWHAFQKWFIIRENDRLQSYLKLTKSTIKALENRVKELPNEKFSGITVIRILQEHNSKQNNYSDANNNVKYK